MRILALLVALSGLPALAASGLSDVAAGSQPLRVEAETQPAESAPKASAKARVERARTRNVRLDPGFSPPTAKSGAPEKPGVPLQVGFARPIASLAMPKGLARQLEWQSAEGGGRVAALSMTSPAATAVRLGVQVESLPAGAMLRFHGGTGTVHEVSAQEVGATLTRDAQSGDASGMFWSPVVESDTVVLEIELPAGVEAEQIRLSTPTLSHLVAGPSTDFALPKAAASCNIDAMCHQGTWGAESNAVARIVFTSGGSSYVCSGTLLADRDTSTSMPYFLTANHCVPNQSTASSVQSFWFFRSSACNSGTRGSYETRTGGGTLLYASGNTDTAFLRLSATPPAGATYAGWAIGVLSTGIPVTGIHHPKGDLQKISFGATRGYYTCVPTTGGQFSCNGASSGSSTYVSVNWSAGLTEGGSGGSGLFTDNGRYLVGQLYGGGGSCDAGGTDFYGRFDVAYNAGLSQWLGATQPAQPTPTPTPSNPVTITPTQNYSALWWNPNESGWGLSVTQHGSVIFAAWYAYDNAGRPTWVVMPGGQWTAPTTFTGDLYMTTGPDGLGSFNPALVSTRRVGSGTLNFASGSQAVLTYTVNGAVGTKSIARNNFGVPDAAPVGNYGDLWWSAAESGWGLSINQQFRTLFAVWYTYGPDGQPLWYVMPGGSWTSDDTYTGTLYRTASMPIPFFGGTFTPSGVAATAVGSLTLRFWAPGNAVMSYTINGVSGSKSIVPQAF